MSGGRFARALRPRARRLAFGLATLAGARPLGFFIPYRHAASAEPAGYPGLVPAFEAAEPGFAALLSGLEALSPELEAIAAAPASPGGPRFNQDWFPRLDAAIAYGLVRRDRPRRIVEIGSGHSTRFLARAIRDGRLEAELTCIDPAPRASLAGLAVRHEPRLLGPADRGLVAALGPGDILFVDSSHVAMPGTDLDILVGEVLPRLASGALLHLHDILLPNPYPRDWAWRGYNEAIVAAALIGAGGYEIVFSSHWVASRRPGWIAAGAVGRLPLAPGARETSLWLRRR